MKFISNKINYSTNSNLPVFGLMLSLLVFSSQGICFAGGDENEIIPLASNSIVDAQAWTEMNIVVGTDTMTIAYDGRYSIDRPGCKHPITGFLDPSLLPRFNAQCYDAVNSTISEPLGHIIQLSHSTLSSVSVTLEDQRTVLLFFRKYGLFHTSIVDSRKSADLLQTVLQIAQIPNLSDC